MSEELSLADAMRRRFEKLQPDVPITDEGDTGAGLKNPEYTDNFAASSSPPLISLSGNVVCYTKLRFKGDNTVTGFTVGRDVKKIEYSTFEGCHELASLNGLADSKVTVIGAAAFKDCWKIASLAGLPETLVTIESCAFELTRFTSLEGLPRSVRTIGAYAFHENAWLSDVDEGLFFVTQIDDYAFLGTAVESVRLCRTVKRGGELMTFPEGCDIQRMEPHLRRLFLLCVMSESEIQIGGAMLGKLDLWRARDNFRHSGECVGLWRHVLTYV